MGQEIELKLSAPPAVLDEAAALPWLQELACGEAKREKLISVYFDTPKAKLRDRGLALRVRHVGEKRLQTIKAIGKGGRGPLGRDEWEQEVAGATPDLALAKGTALRPLVTRKLRRKLRPVFETSVERVTLPVRVGGSEIEVALDRGHIKAAGRREPISEIEIELKRGDRTDLARFAARLARSLPLAYGPRPKQDRGYALRTKEEAAPIKAAGIALTADASTADAFRVIALACLDHALANERAVRDGDAEGIHQMRVGLRRLRATLSLFKLLLLGPQMEAIKTELKWLTDELGPARELDVLIVKRIEPARETAPIGGIDLLARELAADLDEDFDRARRAVESERYRRLGLKAALWIIDGEWSQHPNAANAARQERPAADFAAEVLGGRLTKILKRARQLERLPPRRRHKLRIAVKKLRYATDFFAGSFSGSKRDARRRRFVEGLKALQSALGALNDFEAHKGIAGGIAQPRKRDRRQPQKALAIGFVTGQEKVQVAPCLAAARDAAKRLEKAPVFWG